MSGLKMFDIDQMYRDALDAARARIGDDGVIPDDWDDFLTAIEGERDTKACNIAVIIIERNAESDALKEQAKRLLTRARVIDNETDRIKNWLSRFIKVGEKVKNSIVSISWRKSSSVVVDDETKLPESAFRVIREVSKTAVKEMIERGEEISGAHIEIKQNIQVR